MGNCAASDRPMAQFPLDPRSAPRPSEPAFAALAIGLFMTFNPKDASRPETFCEARAELRSHARFTCKEPLRGSQKIEYRSSGYANLPCPVSFTPCQSP